MCSAASLGTVPTCPPLSSLNPTKCVPSPHLKAWTCHLLSASSSPCSARVIQILPQELGDRTVPVGIAHLTTTVQAFTHCEASSQHVVTILPPQTHLVPSPSEPLGSELFSPGGSTRDLLSQEEGTRQKTDCKSLSCARWNLAHFARYQFAPLLLQPQAKVNLSGSRHRLSICGPQEGHST
jgi:hypothetical protein